MQDDKEMLEDHVWIVYGKKWSTVSIVPLINVGEIKERKQLLGLLYRQYALQKEATIHNLAKEKLEDYMSHYCLMLQYQD